MNCILLPCRQQEKQPPYYDLAGSGNPIVLRLCNDLEHSSVTQWQQYKPGESLLGNKTLTIKKATDGDVIISGGQSIPANLFKKAYPVGARFHNNAQGKLVVADLSGIPAGSKFKSKTDIKYDEIVLLEAAYSQLAFDGQLLTLARWPNRGDFHIDTIPDKGPSTRFLKPGEKAMGYS